MGRLTPLFWRRPFAHRGLHDRSRGRIENSLAAVRAAVAGGYGIEIDVHPSSDGESMVFHDTALDRLTAETGDVQTRSSTELRRVKLTGGDDCIPTLEEVLSAVDGRVALLVEIKSEIERPRDLEARTAELCLDYARRFPGMIATMSFSPDSMAWMRDHAPDLPRGLVSYGYGDADAQMLTPEMRTHLAALGDFEALDADFVSYGASDLPTPQTRALRARGVPVFCWTIRSAQAASEALRHCDQITFEGFAP